MEFLHENGACNILNMVEAYCTSAVCLANRGSLDVAPITLTGVIRDFDDPCSVHTANDPESFLTISPRSTTRCMYG